MLIRVEIGIDAPGIDALLRRTFGRDAEAQLVHDLREDGLITLGVVATDDEGQVIGYVAFSPVAVEGEEPAYQLGKAKQVQGISWATNAKPNFYDVWIQR